MIQIINTEDLKDPALAVYNGLHETQLKHYYEPAPGLFICETSKVIRRALDAGYEAESVLCEPQLLNDGESDLFNLFGDIPVYVTPAAVLRTITGYHLTGGILCAMRRKNLPDIGALCRNASRIAVLDDIENPSNIGAIFRSAAAMRMDAVLLTKGCSDPLYRRAARVSMGTVFQIPWTVIESPFDVRDLGFCTVALALSKETVRIDDPVLKQKDRIALILGNEGNGLPEKIIAGCDYTAKIPMASGVDSLNVAAASAVAFWELTRDRA